VRSVSRSSARRGQTEPLAALAAVLVLGLALGTYADALAAAEPTQSEPATAEATLQRATDAVTADGAALPGRLGDASAVAPDGYRLNVTLAADDRRWSAGPTPPAGAPDADRRTPVRTGRWSVSPGRLRVVVWA